MTEWIQAVKEGNEDLSGPFRKTPLNDMGLLFRVLFSSKEAVRGSTEPIMGFLTKRG